MKKNLIFKGSGVALVTPMLENGDINYLKLNYFINISWITFIKYIFIIIIMK